VPSPRLVAAVDGLDQATYDGPAYRHLAARWNPLSGAGARSAGGRWNPPESFATLYLAVDRETAVAEFTRRVRAAHLRTSCLVSSTATKHASRASWICEMRAHAPRSSSRMTTCKATIHRSVRRSVRPRSTWGARESSPHRRRDPERCSRCSLTASIRTLKSKSSTSRPGRRRRGNSRRREQPGLCVATGRHFRLGLAVRPPPSASLSARRRSRAGG
jgi:hypothetical protein